MQGNNQQGNNQQGNNQQGNNQQGNNQQGNNQQGNNQQGNNIEILKKYLLINEFVGPKIIIIFYWIMLVVAFIVFCKFFGQGLENASHNSEYSRYNRNYGEPTFTLYLMGIFSFFFIAIIARLVSELMLVLFKINDNITILRKNSIDKTK